MIRFSLQTPLSALPVFSRFLPKLKKLGLTTIKDLLWHFPVRYEDFSTITPIANLSLNQETTIQGVIEDIRAERTWKKRMLIVEATIRDETGSIKAVWFNQPYLRNTLAVGRRASFSGKTAVRGGELYLSHPAYEILPHKSRLTSSYNGSMNFTSSDDVNLIHTGKIIGIYPETKGLTSRGIRFLIKHALERVEDIPEILPEQVTSSHGVIFNGLPKIMKALRDIHFPKNIDDALTAKKRFAFEDLFLLQLGNIVARSRLEAQKAVPLEIDLAYIKDLLSHLPFPLTQSQKKSLWEILQDTAQSHPMNRLLQGDVGSGKTIVAAIAALHTAHHGYQSAFMAPTEILARQHYETFKKFFPGFREGTALLISGEARVFYGDALESKTKKTALMRDIASGKIKIAIGTHALIQKNVSFHNLALVIVDEQHRFGVKQRAQLAHNANNTNIQYCKSTTAANEKNKFASFASNSHDSHRPIPHFLSMSATPIPRTLSLTLFGDLDLSLITEMPTGRKPIITKVVAPENRNKAYAFIRRQIQRGRQAFVICPRIEKANTETASENENKNRRPTNVWRLNLQTLDLQASDVKSVKEEYERLSKKVFPDLKIAMLHGKMKAKEKEKIMSDFKENKIHVLIATSVVEVGVDIPNATIMMIEGAERFGLAQLYQFRGRVGRGKHQSFCFLFTESPSENTARRLRTIEKAKNGLELAEQDLKLRGPGEFFGDVQSGMPDLAMTAIRNPKLMKAAREAALSTLKQDQHLNAHPALKKRLEEFQKKIHLE